MKEEHFKIIYCKGVSLMFGKKDHKKSPRETGGPVVGSGPTAGRNRTKTKSGQWRRKRSDAGTTRGPQNR